MLTRSLFGRALLCVVLPAAAACGGKASPMAAAAGSMDASAETNLDAASCADGSSATSSAETCSCVAGSWRCVPHNEPEAGIPDASTSTNDAPADYAAYGDASAFLTPCTPVCSASEVCVNEPQPDIGCPPAGSESDAGCIQGCPGCQSPPTCGPLPSCPNGLSCDCLLQAFCGSEDASFQTTATTSQCAYGKGTGWILQCGNEL